MMLCPDVGNLNSVVPTTFQCEAHKGYVLEWIIWYLDRRITLFFLAEEKMTKEDEDVMLDNFVTIFIAGKSGYKCAFIPLHVG